MKTKKEIEKESLEIFKDLKKRFEKIVGLLEPLIKDRIGEVDCCGDDDLPKHLSITIIDSELPDKPINILLEYEKGIKRKVLDKSKELSLCLAEVSRKHGKQSKHTSIINNRKDLFHEDYFPYGGFAEDEDELSVGVWGAIEGYNCGIIAKMIHLAYFLSL